MTDEGPSRPRQALRALLSWRDLLPGAGVAALGLLVAATTFGVTRLLGLLLALLGAALLWVGWQRKRFGRGGGGPGIVTVDEGRVAYWGPLKGGVVDLDDLRRLDLDARGRPAAWVLWGPGAASLEVPVTAEGAEALLGAFAALPGLGVERLLAAREADGGALVTVWRRDARLRAVV